MPDIFKAISAGDLSQLDAALKQGASLEARNRSGHSPLAWACVGQHTDLVRRLLDAGADIKAPAVEGTRLLELAVYNSWRHSDTGTLELLIARGAELGDALHQAARIGSYPTESARAASLLIAHSAVVDARDEEGETPLHHAVRTIADDTIAVLLDAGASPNSTNNDGETLLIDAMSSFTAMVKGGMDTDEAAAYQLERVPRLLAAKADPSAANEQGSVPLYVALVQKGYPFEVASALIEAGADPTHAHTMENGSRIHMLTLAYMRGAPTPLLCSLVERGADLHQPVNAKGESVLEVARRQRPDVAAALEATAR